MIASYDPNTAFKFVRNPHFKEWSDEAQPDGYPDEIAYDFGLTEEAAVTAVPNGQADWMYDPPRPTAWPSRHQIPGRSRHAADRDVVRADEHQPGAVRRRQCTAGGDFAIDRKALVKLFGGPSLAQPVCQVLPPDFPAMSLLPLHPDPGDEMDGARPGEGQGAGAGIRHGGAGGDHHHRGQRVSQSSASTCRAC